MQKKYTISLIVIVLMIVSLFVIYTNYQIYQNSKEDFTAVTLMTDDLSVNFLNGNPIVVNEKTKEIQFSVTNYSSKNLFYSIKLQNVSGTPANSTFEIIRDEKEANILDFKKEVILNRHEISKGETERYTMKINNEEENNFTFELLVEIDPMNHEFQNMILKNKVFEETEEAVGLIKKKEQQGDVYYFKGNVQNNYMELANHLWRIVKINEDGTVKLVLDSTTENMVAMFENELEENSFFDTSVYNSLEEWYEMNLKDNDSFISSTKYCYDDGVLFEEESSFTYLPSVRLFDDKLPSYTCNGTQITSKIALMTGDEVMIASSNEKESYLNNNDLQAGWWTMTPSKREGKETFYISINQDGTLQKSTSGNKKLFIKPVITLNRKVKVIGDGTKKNPYQIEK